MRLYLNIPINQLLSKEKCICSNSPQLTLRHALNCSKLITYRSSLQHAVRDTVFNMAQTARISCIKEPLLKETLSLNNFECHYHSISNVNLGRKGWAYSCFSPCLSFQKGQ
ncbi:hypothetical protein P9112_013723 [Eukaryota sp. TZLM1-RC]